MGRSPPSSRPKGVIKVKTIELNLIYTLLISIAVFFVGRALINRASVLKRFGIPAPVVGEGLVAVSRLEMMRR
jgi:sodium--glutamate symport carrier gltS